MAIHMAMAMAMAMATETAIAMVPIAKIETMIALHNDFSRLIIQFRDYQRGFGTW
jgi:hypothetical protein